MSIWHENLAVARIPTHRQSLGCSHSDYTPSLCPSAWVGSHSGRCCRSTGWFTAVCGGKGDDKGAADTFPRWLIYSRVLHGVEPLEVHNVLTCFMQMHEEFFRGTLAAAAEEFGTRPAKV